MIALPSSALGWAFFLASSWTWCIGMYLPVLLTRDYGWWGWVVFAVPNVVGAAAMAWVLRDADASRRVTDHHRAACVVFTLVTIAFHAFFAVYIVRQVAGISVAWLVVPVVGHVLAMSMLRRGGVADRVLAMLTFAVSITAFLIAVLWSETNRAGDSPFGTLPWNKDLLALAPVCVLGFLCCPYLDLTFHRARQSTTPAGGRFAFTVGFGALFLAMISFTLWYAKPLASIPFMPYWNVAGVVILIHIVTQMVFTVSVHTRELRRPMSTGVLGPVLLVGGAGALGFIDLTYPGLFHDMRTGELIYRSFMGMYGLVFPAYVWICMLPSRGAAGPTRRNLLVCAGAVLVALPMFWMGFIERQTLWLLPGVAVVLLARLFARRASR